MANERMDVGALPAYRIPEAAHYLGLPTSTLRTRVLGYRSGPRKYEPVIAIADKKHRRLSFINLVEAYVLGALRRQHRISLPKIRRAVAFLSRQFNSAHPLADESFATNGIDLFVEKYGNLINASNEGRLAMKEVLRASLQRIERDRHGLPVKLYPFTRRGSGAEPLSVVIDPRVSFGRPVISGTGIPTVVIAERYKAGESIEELAKDYG